MNSTKSPIFVLVIEAIIGKPSTRVPKPKKPLKPKKERQKAKEEQSKTSLRAIVGWVATILGLITDELLTLTADLKRQIDKTTPGTLSIDLIKKAAEIEKLTTA